MGKSRSFIQTLQDDVDAILAELTEDEVLDEPFTTEYTDLTVEDDIAWVWGF